jgi:hypothetical protein
MKESRQTQLLNGVSTLAQKTFPFVPIQESWSCTDIHRAMTKGGATSTAFRVVRACLGEMKDAGLIREPKPDFFQREAVKHKTVEQPYLRDATPAGYTPNGMIIREEKFVPKNPPQGNKDVSNKAPAVVASEAKTVSAVELLTELAVDFGDFAEQVAKSHKAFASRLVDISAQIENDLSSNSEELEKLRSLKSLLKSLG